MPELRTRSPRNFTQVIQRLDDDYAVGLVANPAGDTLRVGNVFHWDGAEGLAFTGRNTLSIEVPVEAVDGTEADRYSEFHDIPETVYRAEIPAPEECHRLFDEADLDPRDGPVTTPARDDVVRELQRGIEEQNYRTNRLDARTGDGKGLPAEWDPKDPHNDDRSRRHLHDMASMGSEGYSMAWYRLTGFWYFEMIEARMRLLDRHEPHLEPYEIVALDVLDLDDEEGQCRQCGTIRAREKFLYVSPSPDVDYRVRCCGRCANRRYRAEQVHEAHTHRAKEHGGQTKLVPQTAEGGYHEHDD